MNIAFVHVPKAAGGSIRNWLEKNSKEYNFSFQGGHAFLDELRDQTETPFDWSFSIVRNSYNRMISAYVFMNRKINDRIKRCRKQSLDEEMKYWIDLDNVHKKGICYFLQHMKFENNSHRFFTSQLEWINGVSCILKYENIDEEFKIVQEN